MHPTAVAAFCRHAGQRARGGVGARDGLEVERESFGRPSRRIRYGKRRSENQTQSFTRYSFQ
jgi:hypothetical protein